MGSGSPERREQIARNSAEKPVIEGFLGTIAVELDQPVPNLRRLVRTTRDAYAALHTLNPKIHENVGSLRVVVGKIPPVEQISARQEIDVLDVKVPSRTKPLRLGADVIADAAAEILREAADIGVSVPASLTREAIQGGLSRVRREARADL